MKLKMMRIRNFRGYHEAVDIPLDSFTAFVGKNDVGKSTILEALDIFFHDGKGVIGIDKDDLNITAKETGEAEFFITCCFSDLPDSIVVDSSYETTLADEYLLNADGLLEIEKQRNT